MLQPSLVTVEGGFRLCGVCGEMLLNGDSALFMADAYCHVTCEKHNVPEEWKVARRLDAYLATNPDKESPEYWENMLTGVEVNQRERQYPIRKFEDGEEDTEPIATTGQRWNGNVLADARAVLDEADARCDRPLVARLMVELAEKAVVKNEREEYTTTWTREALAENKRNATPILTFWDDERTNIGLMYVNGRLVDNLPTEEIFTNDDSEESEGEGTL